MTEQSTLQIAVVGVRVTEETVLLLTVIVMILEVAGFPVKQDEKFELNTTFI